MRRALATFRQAGVDVVPTATDYRVVEENGTLLAVLPDSKALSESTAAIREYVGYVVYDWRGWIADGRGKEANRVDTVARSVACLGQRTGGKGTVDI